MVMIVVVPFVYPAPSVRNFRTHTDTWLGRSFWIAISLWWANQKIPVTLVRRLVEWRRQFRDA